MVARDILDQHQQTTSHAKCSITNYNRMHTRHKHTTLAWRNKHSTHTWAPISCITQTHKILHHITTHETHNLQQPPIYHQRSHKPKHCYHNRHNIQMRHIHTSIFSKHLAKRRDNKILRTLTALKRHFPNPKHLMQRTHSQPTSFNCTYIHTKLSPLDLWTDPAAVAQLLPRWKGTTRNDPFITVTPTPPQPP